RAQGPSRVRRRRPRRARSAARRRAVGRLAAGRAAVLRRRPVRQPVGVRRIELSSVLAEYDLPGLEATLLRTTNNDVYELRATGFHGVLRVHRPEYRTPAHVRSELRFLEALPE